MFPLLVEVPDQDLIALCQKRDRFPQRLTEGSLFVGARGGGQHRSIPPDLEGMKFLGHRCSPVSLDMGCLGGGVTQAACTDRGAPGRTRGYEGYLRRTTSFRPGVV